VRVSDLTNTLTRPHVLPCPLSNTEFGSSDSFSPDGQWLATYVGSSTTSATQDYFSASHLRVVSTNPTDETYLIPYSWHGYESAVATTDFDPPRWLDNQQFAVYGFPEWGNNVGWHIYNPFTSQIILAPDTLAEQLTDGYAYQFVFSILIRALC
jgi:hypothetical protein